ncbi:MULTISPECIES: nitrate reductase molybdenum cofactor assembly chaperone [unclassified Arthrobacter]|uniref:nitrate reductase molybdenum cofactor assembly chaperone n=1 Tax=unclassified Arthrobacter TaxID=235627 RepID=UPI001D154A9F|nr:MULTISPECIES: nitrate reductase molybdenum cofactor assembly chaperone [unclassified Arthrobacter]MCC3278109.1 nitrate reductase molybdenum cofactor assembly chaperone [Arthrobacter sp. zg-Y40]MCC9176502.1 nitrate reductase molybdenum cofactor assembly chaperone [Arthrobacter sp. zg-Y750]MCC3275911.1 nitrate reductase molybdenum cofactor assembly chaperone [Arthrobacter sp. zg-Y20]MDK1316068.1 nitrate reductase molybdenum cofactor assembly chaperone [Arthrobacter sp. zg.Y20]WIB05641.1 nitra
MSLLEKLLGKPGKGTLAPEPYADQHPARSRAIRQAAALLLEYPDRQLLDLVPAIRSALAEAGAGSSELDPLFGWFADTPLRDVQSAYVQEFDLSKRHSLHLTYWTDGDTRRRGEALAAFKEIYRSHGVLPEGTELPDYLPLVLEFAAKVSPQDGYELLQRYRPSVELLRLALRDDGLPHEGVLTLLCTTLPGVSPEDAAAVMRTAGYGPPTETVGLEPYSSRLLPVSERNSP